MSAGRIDDAPVEGEQRLRIAAQVGGQLVEVRIQAHADQAVGGRDARSSRRSENIERHAQ